MLRCAKDTIDKLRLLHPGGALDTDRQFCPSRDDTRAFWGGEDGIAILEQHFSVAKIKKYFQGRLALGSSDIGRIPNT